MSWPHDVTAVSAYGALLMCKALGAYFTSLSVLLNTQPRGGGLNLSYSRNAGSGKGGGNRFAPCTSGVFKRVNFLRSRNLTTARGGTSFT